MARLQSSPITSSISRFTRSGSAPGGGWVGGWGREQVPKALTTSHRCPEHNARQINIVGSRNDSGRYNAQPGCPAQPNGTQPEHKPSAHLAGQSC